MMFRRRTIYERCLPLPNKTSSAQVTEVNM